jgi:hypothetical protein
MKVVTSSLLDHSEGAVKKLAEVEYYESQVAMTSVNQLYLFRAQ